MVTIHLSVLNISLQCGYLFEENVCRMLKHQNIEQFGEKQAENLVFNVKNDCILNKVIFIFIHSYVIYLMSSMIYSAFKGYLNVLQIYCRFILIFEK